MEILIIDVDVGVIVRTVITPVKGVDVEAVARGVKGMPDVETVEQDPETAPDAAAPQENAAGIAAQENAAGIVAAAIVDVVTTAAAVGVNPS